MDPVEAYSPDRSLRGKLRRRLVQLRLLLLLLLLE